jgi:hypothetical protein
LAGSYQGVNLLNSQFSVKTLQRHSHDQAQRDARERQLPVLWSYLELNSTSARLKAFRLLATCISQG